MTGLFVSDLHLFSRRSVGQAAWAAARVDLKAVELLVLGGDVFDFRWSLHRELNATIAAAINWLRQLLDDLPNLQVAYLLGNHDCHPELQLALTKLANESKRFRWHEYELRIGAHLFLHGDELDAGSFNLLPTYRRQFHEHQARGPLANLVYDAAVAARIHIALPAILHREVDVCKRLLDSIGARGLAASDGVRFVYFGHTHRLIDALEYRRQTFFNPGAAIKHCQFQPLRFKLD